MDGADVDARAVLRVISTSGRARGATSRQRSAWRRCRSRCGSPALGRLGLTESLEVGYRLSPAVERAMRQLGRATGVRSLARDRRYRARVATPPTSTPLSANGRKAPCRRAASRGRRARRAGRRLPRGRDGRRRSSSRSTRRGKDPDGSSTATSSARWESNAIIQCPRRGVRRLGALVALSRRRGADWLPLAIAQAGARRRRLLIPVLAAPVGHFTGAFPTACARPATRPSAGTTRRRLLARLEIACSPGAGSSSATRSRSPTFAVGGMMTAARPSGVRFRSPRSRTSRWYGRIEDIGRLESHGGRTVGMEDDDEHRARQASFGAARGRPALHPARRHQARAEGARPDLPAILRVRPGLGASHDDGAEDGLAARGPAPVRALPAG